MPSAFTRIRLALTARCLDANINALDAANRVWRVKDAIFRNEMGFDDCNDKDRGIMSGV